MQAAAALALTPAACTPHRPQAAQSGQGSAAELATDRAAAVAAAERNAAEVQRLRAELAHLQATMAEAPEGEATGGLPASSTGACRTTAADISDAQVGCASGWASGVGVLEAWPGIGWGCRLCVQPSQPPTTLPPSPPTRRRSWR